MLHPDEGSKNQTSPNIPTPCVFFDRKRRRRDGGREANGPGRKVHNGDELRDGGTALRGKETVS